MKTITIQISAAEAEALRKVTYAPALVDDFIDRILRAYIITPTKEECQRLAEREGDHEVGAGSLPSLPPVKSSRPLRPSVKRKARP